MSMEYFDGDGYGWEDELSRALPETPDESDLAEPDSGLMPRTIVGSQAVINSLFSQAYESAAGRITFSSFLEETESFAGNYYTDFTYGHPATETASTTSGTYAGITRSNTTPWRTFTW